MLAAYVLCRAGTPFPFRLFSGPMAKGDQIDQNQRSHARKQRLVGLPNVVQQVPFGVELERWPIGFHWS